MAIHGASPDQRAEPERQHVVLVRPGGFIDSCSQPNRIIATLAPAIAMTASIPVIPV